MFCVMKLLLSAKMRDAAAASNSSQDGRLRRKRRRNMDLRDGASSPPEKWRHKLPTVKTG